MFTKVLAAVGSAALLVTLAACASTPTVTSTPLATAPAASTDTPAPSDSSTPSDQAKFGSTATFDTGVAVTISKGKVYKPGSYASSLSGEITAKPVVYTVTIKNGGTDPLPGMSVTTSATSGTAEAPQIIDTEKGIKGILQSTVLPGKTIVYKVAFDAANPADVTIDVSPDYVNHVYFSN